jgi:outer membrane protease
VKKILAAWAFWNIAFLLPVYGDTFFDGYNLYAEGTMGFLVGTGDELLYQPDGSDNYISRLVWDIKPLFYYGLALGFEPKDAARTAGLFAELGIRSGLSGGNSGNMRDYDWIGGSGLSHYSEHEAVIERAVLVDLRIGVSVPAFSSVYMRLYGGIEYDNILWTAQNGFFRYPSQSPSEGKFTGPVGNYVQGWLVAYPGVSAYIDFAPFTADISFAISPLLRMDAVDNHLLLIDNTSGRFSNYRFSAEGELYLKPSCKLTLVPSAGVSFSLIYSFTWFKSGKGDCFLQNTGTNSNNGTVYRASNKTGGALQAHEIGLSAHITIR